MNKLNDIFVFNLHWIMMWLDGSLVCVYRAHAHISHRSYVYVYMCLCKCNACESISLGNYYRLYQTYLQWTNRVVFGVFIAFCHICKTILSAVAFSGLLHLAFSSTMNNTDSSILYLHCFIWDTIRCSLMRAVIVRNCLQCQRMNFEKKEHDCQIMVTCRYTRSRNCMFEA